MTAAASSPYPGAVIVTASARATMDMIAREMYTAQRCEWGGLLWGHVFASSTFGAVPVVLAATRGRCIATHTRCEILPESWDEGRELLQKHGRGDLINLGDWHSHPRMGVFLSPTDVISFWSRSYLPDWLSIVTDPYACDCLAFAKQDEHTCQAFRPLFVDDRTEELLHAVALRHSSLEVALR